MKFTDTAGGRSCWIATTKMIASFLSRRYLNIWLFYNARQASWGNFWKHAVEKNLINATNVTYASSWVMNLRTHLKMHSGEKSYKCKQCDFPSYQADDLRTHLKIHNDTQWRKNLTNVTNVTRLAIKQAIWEHIWKHTVEKVKQMQPMRLNETRVQSGNLLYAGVDSRRPLQG